MVRTHPNVSFKPNGKIDLSHNGYENFISINGDDFEMKYLNDKPGNKGGNSMVLRLVPEENDEDEISDEYVIKISNIALEKTTKFDKNRRKRFEREIIALRKANLNNCPNVVKYITHGEIRIQDNTFEFYVMEKAQSDLTDYLRPRRTIQQKVLIFKSILKCIKQLHNIGIYHRDIKHDNFLIVNNECKVGDLGLMRFKEEDNLVLDRGQRIGAFGWETPEAMNMFLNENLEDPEYDFDNIIDDSSDIFQLGKLFWYILQGNLPIGCLHLNDFRVNDPDLFGILVELLQQSKLHAHGGRPSNIAAVELLLEPIIRKYAA